MRSHLRIPARVSIAVVRIRMVLYVGMQSLREVVTLALCFKVFPDPLPEDQRRDPTVIAAALKIPVSFARRIAELEWVGNMSN